MFHCYHVSFNIGIIIWSPGFIAMFEFTKCFIKGTEHVISSDPPNREGQNQGVWNRREI